MREINADKITGHIASMCIDVNCCMDKNVVKFLKKAYNGESFPLAKEVLSRILKNAEIASQKKIPICQDTGVVIVFLEIGQDVHIIGKNLEQAVNDGVREGYQKGYLRKSMVISPLPSCRKNTNDNTPAIIYTDIVPGDKIKIKFLVKGAGSENMSALKMFNPTTAWEQIEDFIVESIKKAGANPCPPTIIGIGIGGTFEKCAILAKKAGLRDFGIKNKDKKIALLETKLLKKINSLNIGPLGLGGKTTSLAINIETYPCHIASLPVAVNINCFAYRHKVLEI